MPEHCIKQYEKMIRFRAPRSKPLQVIKEKTKLHSYKYHAIDPATLPSSNEINSISNAISYNDLASANNYNNLISFKHYNFLASPSDYNDLSSSNQYRSIPNSNNYNDWTSSANQHNNPNSGNKLGAPVQHIYIDDVLHNDLRVDHGDKGHGYHRHDDDNGDQIDRHEDHVRNGDHGDYSHYIDLGRHRGHVSFPQRALQKKHKKLVHQSEPVYSQESLELVYNSLHNIMNVESFNMNEYDESSENTKHRNYNSHQDRKLRHEHARRQVRNRNRQRARHLEHALHVDQMLLNETDDNGLIYDYGHDTKRSRNDDENDSNEYQYAPKHNYNDNYNDLFQESHIGNYVFDTQDYGKYLAINSASTSEPYRRRRQNFPQDAMFTGDYYVSPFNIESVIDLESLTSDDEPAHIPNRGYQSPVQSMLHAIESDVQNQPIAPQIGVLPFLGVSAIYHQPISKNSVKLIKDVAHSYQETAKEQYKEMEKYYPRPPPPPPTDCSGNVTLSPVELYPGQRKDEKLINKIRHKILDNAKHFKKEGEKKHKVTTLGCPLDNIFFRRYK